MNILIFIKQYFDKLLTITLRENTPLCVSSTLSTPLHFWPSLSPNMWSFFSHQKILRFSEHKAGCPVI